MLRAVVDTNVRVSALLNPAGYPARVLEAFRNGRFVPVLSQPLVDALIEVLSRPRLVRKYETALTGGASYPVSRDDDNKRDEDLVLSMKRKGVSILSVSDFLARLE